MSHTSHFQWIFDCGATDTMTFDPHDLSSIHSTPRTHVQIANGATIPVHQAGPADISSSLSVKNYLLIPSLSHKLLFVSKLTKELHCMVLFTSDGCLVQDTRTGTILGRSTEQGGLYYVDETVKKGHSLLAQGTPIQKLWIWHRRLGHPSLSYLKRLFPSFHSYNLFLDCEAYVLAKSHKHSYSPSLTRIDRPFALVHSDV